MSNINTSELDGFAKDLLKLASSDLPKESKKFIRKEGKSLLQETQKEVIFSGIHHKNHTYYDSIKQGKVYKYKQNGAISNRVYSSDPKSHLLEDGHRMITHNGKEVGFVEGYHVFKNSAKSFESTFNSDCEEFVENTVIKGLSE
ncbi:HK97 gp10 family phage protein [Clostridium botulinum]|uniref:HK97 gp10 family phage protein n=1 Tax=Clostridium botulinum TaxID=1491 RepID=UPI001967F03E|nr:HK97 gp10 family phage protein [Clostridium botulinum]MBN1079271.1 HK97 gp10 family phage protein [Clostridium botulinum]